MFVSIESIFSKIKSKSDCIQTREEILWKNAKKEFQIDDPVLTPIKIKMLNIKKQWYSFYVDNVIFQLSTIDYPFGLQLAHYT